MKALIFGASGFVGSHIAEELFNRGHRCILHEKAVCDLLDYNRTKEYIDHIKPEIVINSAALSGGISWNQNNFDRIYFDNTIMALHCLKTCAESKIIKRVISLVSSCAYGDLAGDLIEERFWTELPHSSIRFFGLQKRNMVAYSMALRAQYPHKDFICPIINNLYGPRDSFDPAKTKVVGNTIKKFVEARNQTLPNVTIWGDGSPTRQFLYVKDAANAVAEIMENYLLPENMVVEPEDFIINVTTEEETSIKELAELTKELTRYHGNIIYDTSKPNGQLRKSMNGDKIATLLNWKAQTPLQIGLATTIKWYEGNNCR